MKNLILLLLFSWISFCQTIENEDFLIIEGESLKYFYILTEDGYYISELEGKNTFKEYSKEIPKSLNAPFSTLIPLLHNSQTYLLYPGGGLLYTFSDGSINRVDRSFPHRNQYGAHFFSYKENIFLIGGYGYWQTKSIITKFNFNSGDWELVNTKGQDPVGIDRGTYFIDNNKLYVFDFMSREINTQKEKRNENLYVLDLDSFEWKKLGVINDNIELINIKNKGVKRFFRFEDKLIFSYSDTPEFFVVDIDNNSFESFKDEMLFYKSNSQFIIKNNNLIGPIKNTLTGETAFEKFDLTNITNYPIGEASYFFRDKEEFFQYIYFALFFITVLIIVLSAYHKMIDQTYIIDENSISVSGVSHQLSPIEISILSLFTRNRNVLNAELMQLFIRDDKTKDYAVKRKNKTIVNLEAKLFKFFNIDLIDKKKSKGDSRQLTYTLNKKIRIIEDITE